MTDKPTEVFSSVDKLPYEALPDCPVCKGIGFVHPRNQNGSIDAARVISCGHPGCLRDQLRAYRQGQIIESSGVTERQQTFENFDASVRGVAKAYKTAEKIAEGLGGFKWLLLYGGVGNGKSHLLNAIANRWMERGNLTRLVEMAELLSELRMAMNDNQMDFKLKEHKGIPYLLIDEYGLELGTPFEKQKIEELLAARWNWGLHTVVATNQDIEDLPIRLKSRFLDRIQSRAVLNEAEDYRLTRGRK